MFSLATLERMNHPDFFVGDGAVYCRKHAGDNPDNDPDLTGLHEYSGGTWDSYPTCEVCGAVCEDVELSEEGRRRECPGEVAEELLRDYENGRKLSREDQQLVCEHATPARLVEAYNERLEYVDDEPPVVAAARTATAAYEARERVPGLLQAALDALAAAIEHEFKVRFIQAAPEGSK